MFLTVWIASGDTELLTGAPYKHTVRAIRQAALSEVPEALLEYLALHYPSILTHIARNVSHKQQIEHKYTNTSASPGVTSKSIMLTPVTGSVPLDLVSSTLKTCLGHCAGKVQLITRYHVGNVVFVIIFRFLIIMRLCCCLILLCLQCRCGSGVRRGAGRPLRVRIDSYRW